MSSDQEKTKFPDNPVPGVHSSDTVSPPPAYELLDSGPSPIRISQPAMQPPLTIDLNISSTIQHTEIEIHSGTGGSSSQNIELQNSAPQNTICKIICCPFTTIYVSLLFPCVLGCAGCFSVSREMMKN